MFMTTSSFIQQIPDGHWLPIIFAALMGLSILIYVILDGFDLGVGILFVNADDTEKDTMIASIGPFWDANETWLVMAVGLLLVAFPVAHGVILTALYIPVFVMLLGLILRGVAFDFRVKAPSLRRPFWDGAFFVGSLMAASAQGYMLGIYIIGLEQNLVGVVFGLLCGLCLIAGYAFIGSCWLIMKAEGELQRKAVQWARITIGFVALGLAAVSLVTPMVSSRIFSKWFALPEIILLLPVPLITAAILLGLNHLLKKYPLSGDAYNWVPFSGAVTLFVLGFLGMAYSFYPFVIPDKMTVWQASSAPEALLIILAGAALVLPMILAYSIYVYWVFWGKSQPLTYGE